MSEPEHIVVCVDEDDPHQPEAVRDVCVDCRGGIWRMPHTPTGATHLCVPCVRARMVLHQRAGVAVAVGATPETVADPKRIGALRRDS